MFGYIIEDWRANAGNTKGRFIAVFFRLAHASGATKNKLLILFGKFPVFVYKMLVNWIMGVDLDHRVKAGPGLKIFHGQGLVVNSETTIGRNVTLRHNTTIGNNKAGGRSPVIGDNVDIGNVHLGNAVVVGAGSVVVKDVAPATTVVGNPARALPQKELHNETCA